MKKCLSRKLRSKDNRKDKHLPKHLILERIFNKIFLLFCLSSATAPRHTTSMCDFARLWFGKPFLGCGGWFSSHTLIFYRITINCLPPLCETHLKQLQSLKNFHEVLLSNAVSFGGL